MVSGIEAAPATENTMTEQKTETTETKAAAKPAKKGKAKREAKPKKAATTKPVKAKKERAPKEDLVVFALRLTAAERTKLHETAGPRGATRMARQVLVAAASEDQAAFKAAIDEARRARA